MTSKATKKLMDKMRVAKIASYSCTTILNVQIRGESNLPGIPIGRRLVRDVWVSMPEGVENISDIILSGAMREAR